MSGPEARAETVAVEPAGGPRPARSPAWGPARSPARGPLHLARGRLLRDRWAVAALAVLGLTACFALSAPLLALWTGHSCRATYPGSGLDITGHPVGPNAEFWLGADSLGRDVLVRAAYGARISLLVGVLSTALATALGVGAGTLAGFAGGWVEVATCGALDAVLAFPYLILAIAAATVFGPGVPLTIIVIAFFNAAGMARIVRGQVVSIRRMDYIEAARALGSGLPRTIVTEVLPNLVAPVAVRAAVLVPIAIIFEATLSFLGAGVAPPTPTWGVMLGEAQDYYRTAWWLLAVPGGLLLLTTLAFNVLADGVRDAFDPRTGRC